MPVKVTSHVSVVDGGVRNVTQHESKVSLCCSNVEMEPVQPDDVSWCHLCDSVRTGRFMKRKADSASGDSLSRQMNHLESFGEMNQKITHCTVQE